MLRVTVKYGKETHDVEVDGGGTLGALCARVENVTGVPAHLQKLVFKGKSAQAPAPGEPDPPLLEALKLKNGAKIMLLGRKVDPAREALMEVLVKEDEATAAVGRKLDALAEQLDRVEKGFADELGEKACDQLVQRVAGCVDELEKGLERLDGVDVAPSDRALRKASVVNIQAMLKRADGLSERIDAARAAPAPGGGHGQPEQAVDID